MHINSLQAYNHTDAKAASTVLWVPSEKIVMHGIEKPTAPTRKWPELVPWLLEERLLQAVDEMHFVITGQNSENTIDVLVTSKKCMQEWLRLAYDAQITNFSLVPDYLALPWQQGSICVALDNNRLIVRNGENSGFAAQPEQAWQMVEALIAESPEPLILSVSHDTSLEEVADTLRIQAKQNRLSLDWLSAQTLPKANLLVGEFKQQASSKYSRRWWSVAALVLLCFGLYFSYTTYSINKLQIEVANLQQVRNSQFTSLFPNLRQSYGNIQAPIEQELEKRFKQREVLATPGILLLSSLDRLLSTCACKVESIELDRNQANIVLSSNTEEQMTAFVVPGFRTELRPMPDSTHYLLAIRQEVNP